MSIEIINAANAMGTLNSSVAQYAPTIILAVGSFLVKTAYSYIRLKLEEVQKETENKELARLLQAAKLEEHVLTQAISYAEEKKRVAKKKSKDNPDIKVPAPEDMLDLAISYIAGISGPESTPFVGLTRDDLSKKIEAVLFGKRKEGLK